LSIHNGTHSNKVHLARSLGAADQLSILDNNDSLRLGWLEVPRQLVFSDAGAARPITTIRLLVIVCFSVLHLRCIKQSLRDCLVGFT
jgi:hypothetical protein